MKDFILLMHDDVLIEPLADQWAAYFSFLRAQGAFGGGSAIGAGEAFRKLDSPLPVNRSLTGYIRLSAGNMVDARALLQGNPVFECGGTVEIRELPRDQQRIPGPTA